MEVLQKLLPWGILVAFIVCFVLVYWQGDKKLRKRRLLIRQKFAEAVKYIQENFVHRNKLVFYLFHTDCALVDENGKSLEFLEPPECKMRFEKPIYGRDLPSKGICVSFERVELNEREEQNGNMSLEYIVRPVNSLNKWTVQFCVAGSLRCVHPIMGELVVRNQKTGDIKDGQTIRLEQIVTIEGSVYNISYRIV